MNYNAKKLDFGLVQYASSVSVLDPVTDLETEQLKCKPCEPGTWNTCKYKESCKW